MSHTTFISSQIVNAASVDGFELALRHSRAELGAEGGGAAEFSFEPRVGGGCADAGLEGKLVEQTALSGRAIVGGLRAIARSDLDHLPHSAGDLDDWEMRVFAPLTAERVAALSTPGGRDEGLVELPTGVSELPRCGFLVFDSSNPPGGSAAFLRWIGTEEESVFDEAPLLDHCGGRSSCRVLSERGTAVGPVSVARSSANTVRSGAEVESSDVLMVQNSTERAEDVGGFDPEPSVAVRSVSSSGPRAGVSTGFEETLLDEGAAPGESPRLHLLDHNCRGGRSSCRVMDHQFLAVSTLDGASPAWEEELAPSGVVTNADHAKGGFGPTVCGSPSVRHQPGLRQSGGASAVVSDGAYSPPATDTRPGTSTWSSVPGKAPPALEDGQLPPPTSSPAPAEQPPSLHHVILVLAAVLIGFVILLVVSLIIYVLCYKMSTSRGELMRLQQGECLFHNTGEHLCGGLRMLTIFYSVVGTRNSFGN